MTGWRLRLALGAAAALAGAGPVIAAPADYPTEVLAEYVFGCMAVNGQTQDALRRCSCSIDKVASAVPFDEYVAAETVLRMRQLPGGDDRAVMFRQMQGNQAKVDRLRAVQVEAEQACFN